MKKIFSFILCLLFLSQAVFAKEEILLDDETISSNAPIGNNSLEIKHIDNDSIRLESAAIHSTPLHHSNPETVHPHYRFYDELARTAHNVYNLQVENTNTPACLLKEPLTKHFESGPLESVHTWGVLQLNNAYTIPEHGGGSDKFNVGLINALIDGTFRGGKENFRIMFDPTPQHNRDFSRQFIQDLYVESHRIKNNVILVGNSRVGGGIEATQSPYTLPFINRSQIARNLGNSRKFGVRVKGNYALADYDFGGYSSDTFWTSFFPGGEFNAMVNIKPLGLTDGRYGKLRMGGGIITGENSGIDYFVSSAYLGYEYKKFWTRMEYANSDGSNGGDGLTNKKRQGWCATVGYHLTKKVEFLARYDEFDPDKNTASNNKREYTAGINYYIKGQALKLILNYVFCQNEAKPDSHRIVVGTQIAI